MLGDAVVPVLGVVFVVEDDIVEDNVVVGDAGPVVVGDIIIVFVMDDVFGDGDGVRV